MSFIPHLIQTYWMIFWNLVWSDSTFTVISWLGWPYTSPFVDSCCSVWRRWSIGSTKQQTTATAKNMWCTVLWWVALTFFFSIIFTFIPNQICVALQESHGWYSVLGTVMGAAGFGLLAYETYKKSKEQQKSKSN